MKSAQTRKIFVGAKPLVRKILGNALACEFDLMHCNDLEHAKLLLVEPIDLILCSVMFDGSRMFDLLRYVKTNPETKIIPFVAIRVLQGALPHHEVAAATAAVKLLGADEFVDMHSWLTEMGEEPACEKLRSTLRKLL